MVPKKNWLSPLFGFFDILSGGKSEGWEARNAIKNLNGKTEVKRQPSTFVVNIGAYSEDPEMAAAIANTMVDVYLIERADDRAGTAVRTSDSMKERLPELKKQVEIAENKAARFKAENDLFDAQGRSIGDEEILRLNDQLAAARSSTISLNARADSAKALTVDGVLSDGLPEEINSNALNALRAQYTTAKQRYDGLQVKLGPMHPDLQQAGTESASLRTSIETEIKRIRFAIQTDLRRAVQTEQALASRLAEMKAKLAKSGDAVVQLREIEREAASARTVYEQFLLRAQETGEQGTIDNANVKRTNIATPSEEPVSTSRKLIALGGIFGGLLFGLALAILAGIWDALKAQYGGTLGATPPLSPAPRPPSGTRKRVIRGTFQSNDPVDAVLAARQLRRPRQSEFAQYNELVAEARQDEPPAAKSEVLAQVAKPAAAPANVPVAQPPQYPVSPTMQSLPAPMYAPQQPMFVPQMQQPWFVPQPVMMPQMMMPQMAMPQMMMPQMVVQQPMPQPVQMAQYSAPIAAQAQPIAQPEFAPQPVQAQAVSDKPATVQIQTRPLAKNAPLSDIQDSLADMKAELLSLARQRRQA